MSVRGCVCAALLVCFARPAQAQSVFTIDEAVREAIERNMTLLAERVNLTVADAAIVTARLRPNPVLSGGANSLDWLGTGFNEVNGAGPPEYSVRVDVPFPSGHPKIFVHEGARQAFERKLLDAEALSMIEGVLQVSETQVRDVMIPR